MPVRAFGRRPRPALPGGKASVHRIDARAKPPAGEPSAASPVPAGTQTRAPAQAPQVPSAPRRITGSDSAISEMVARIHPVIIQSLDMAKIAGLDNETLATQLLGFLESPEAGVPDLTPLDRQRVVTELVHDIKGLGPIEPLLLDPEISDILVNGVQSVYVERRGRLEAVDVRFRDAKHLLHIAQRIASWIGRRVDESSPMVDARLPDGSRVNVIIPPIALDGAAISIRRFVMRGTSLEEMAERNVLSRAMAEAFRIGVKARLNILISGGTGAGKTTFMNALSREIPDGERLITIEDAAELQMQQPHVIRLETRTMSAEGTGQVTMRDLLVNTLRMRPDRIIVGEVRGGEAQEMLQAMNTGHPGSMCTLHANNPRDALIRLENMLMSASGDIPLPALRRQIAGSIDLVVQLARLRTGHRCVTSVTNVVGIENDIVTTEEMWRRRPVETEHVFETSGRQPSWMDSVDAIGLREPLLAALKGDPAHLRGRAVSAFGLALAAAAGLGLLLALGAAGLLAWRRARDPGLERRLRLVAAPLAGAVSTDGAGARTSIFLTRERRTRLRRFIESGYPLLDARRAIPRAVAAGVAAAGIAWFSLWFLRVPSGAWTLPFVCASAAFSVWYALGWLQAKRETEFVGRFPEVVDQIVRLAGAGVPALEALSVAAEDAPDPVGPTLRRVRDNLLAGLDADTALRMASDHVRLAEFTLFAAVIRLQRRAGGGISAAFTNLSETLRERRDTALKSHASTAQTRLTLLVLSLMPVAVLIMQKFSAPKSVGILFGTAQGLTLLRWGVGLIVVGILVARAISARGIQ